MHTLSTCCLRVSAVFTEITQQIHSLRASGVISSHFVRAAESATSALRKSAGTLWTTPVESLPVMPILYTRRLSALLPSPALDRRPARFLYGRKARNRILVAFILPSTCSPAFVSGTTSVVRSAQKGWDLSRVLLKGCRFHPPMERLTGDARPSRERLRAQPRQQQEQRSCRCRDPICVLRLPAGALGLFGEGIHGLPQGGISADRVLACLDSLFGNRDSKLEKYFSSPVRKCSMSYPRS